MEIAKKPLILIVDDTPKNVQVLSSILHEKGYNICVSTSGIQALELISTESPDLILLDIQMPVMDGFEISKVLKANPKTKDIPIIFLTAQTDISYISRAFEVGGIDYISKPFNGIELPAIGIMSPDYPGKHAPSLTTLKKYARAVGCDLKIEFIPKSGLAKDETGGVRQRAG